MTYKTAIENTRFSRSGWDTHEDVEIDYIFTETEEDLRNQVKTYVDKMNNKRSVGDFGITLDSVKSKVIAMYEIVPETIVRILD